MFKVAFGVPVIELCGRLPTMLVVHPCPSQVKVNFSFILEAMLMEKKCLSDLPKVDIQLMVHCIPEIDY